MKEGRIKRVEYSNKFLKSLKRLPQKIIKEAEKKEKIFKENPFHPILRTHKFSGRNKESWGFWITYSYRIKFIFLNNEEVLFLDIGTHGIYKQ